MYNIIFLDKRVISGTHIQMGNHHMNEIHKRFLNICVCVWMFLLLPVQVCGRNFWCIFLKKEKECTKKAHDKKEVKIEREMHMPNKLCWSRFLFLVHLHFSVCSVFCVLIDFFFSLRNAWSRLHFGWWKQLIFIQILTQIDNEKENTSICVRFRPYCHDGNLFVKYVETQFYLSLSLYVSLW